MATHSSILAWRIPGKVEPGGLLSMGSHRVRHDWSDLANIYIYTHTHIYIYLYQSQSPNSFHQPLSLGIHTFVLYICVCFCFAIKIIYTIFLTQRPTYMCKYRYDICLSLSDLIPSVWQSLSPSRSLRMTQFHSLLWLSSIHRIDVPRLLYRFLCWWTVRLLPGPGYCEWFKDPHLCCIDLPS